jgi:hypothetical protein
MGKDTKKHTAVEYLKNNLPSLFKDDQSGFYTTLFERAKELEREQIEDAYYEGKQNIPSKTPDEYYSKTYGE